MKVGTKSLLVGSHQFLLHPLFVALAWRLIYKEWPKQIPIWFAFVLHDIGYWGLPNMQGDEGEGHPYDGAMWLCRLFDRNDMAHEQWFSFSAGHSRFYAKRYGICTSPLMRADKYATCLVPLPLYLLMVYASGEVWEYVKFHLDYHGRPGIERPTFFDVLRWAVEIRRDWRLHYGPDAK